MMGGSASMASSSASMTSPLRFKHAPLSVNGVFLSVNHQAICASLIPAQASVLLSLASRMSMPHSHAV